MEDDSDVISCCSMYDRKSYMLPENYEIKIEIEVLGTYKSGVKKYTKYRVHGTDHFGQFEVSRRFREFKKLRDVLCYNWLGCIIPLLPRKKGNFDKDFVEKRKKFLEIFLNKISKLGYLYLDEFFQYFIRNEENFLIICQNYLQPNYKILSKKYKDAFAHLSSGEIQENQLKNIQNLSNSNLIILKSWSKFLKKCEKNLESFQKSHKALFNNIQTLVSQLVPEKKSEDQAVNKLLNPFKDLRYKLKSIIFDLKAVDQSLEKIFSLNKLIHCFQSQIRDYLALIQEIQSGKRHFLTTRSKEDLLNNVEKVYCEVRVTLGHLVCIVEKVYFSICGQFTDIQSAHFHYLATGLKDYATISIENYEKLVIDTLNLESRLFL